MRSLNIQVEDAGNTLLDSELPLTVVKALWPGKFTAWEARQLATLPSEDPGISYLLKVARIHSQGLDFIGHIPPYHVPHTHCRINFDDVNPDRDVVATGTPFLAHIAHDLVACYDASGKYNGNISTHLLSSHAKCIAEVMIHLHPL